MLVDDTLNRGIFGSLCMYVVKPTEAAIRQHMRYHSKILIVDEFEHDNHRQKILELFRTSSRGGEVIRGTINQHGASYKLKHIPWFVAIETGLRKQADVNRYLILELDNLPPGKRGDVKFIPPIPQLRDLGLRLFAVALRHFQAARALSVALRSQQVDGVPGRVVESLSVPMGMYAAIQGEDGAGTASANRRQMGLFRPIQNRHYHSAS